MEVNNMDYVGIIPKIIHYKQETEDQNSKDSEMMAKHDATRILSYVEDIRKTIQFFEKQEMLDLPQTGPRKRVIPDVVAVNQQLKNRWTILVANLWEALYHELTGSNSANDMGSVQVHDAKRSYEILDRIKLIVDESQKEDQPVDTPELADGQRDSRAN